MNLFNSIGLIVDASTQVFVSIAKGFNEYAKAFEGTGRMADRAVKTMELEQEEEILNRFDFDENGKLKRKESKSSTKSDQ
jgi:hypothetical protein